MGDFRHHRRAARRCAGLLLLALAGPAVAAELDTIEQRVRPCAACHGESGRATPDGYYPRIAGKPAGYLYNQLVNFRDGRRRHDLMSYMVDRQRPAYLAEIARHFAALRLPYPPPEPPVLPEAELQMGGELVRNGDRSRDIPSCGHCHGRALMGRQPAIPGLLGLSRDYLVAQIGAWRTGGRHAMAPDCMERIARALSPEEIVAVAAWLAAQPAPAAAPPETADAHLADECGGLAPQMP